MAFIHTASCVVFRQCFITSNFVFGTQIDVFNIPFLLNVFFILIKTNKRESSFIFSIDWIVANCDSVSIKQFIVVFFFSLNNCHPSSLGNISYAKLNCRLFFDSFASRCQSSCRDHLQHKCRT